MIEHEQIFVMRHCKMCSDEKDKWGRRFTNDRMFISHANNPNKFICTSPGCCGYTEELTDEEIEETKIHTSTKEVKS